MAGQIKNYTGATASFDDLPKARWMLADEGYDAEWFRDALPRTPTSTPPDSSLLP